MSKEKEEQYCLDDDCKFASNVVLLSHHELGFWQGIRTRLHLIICDSCKQRMEETLAVRGHFLSLNGFPSPGLPIRISPKFIRMQVAIASVVAVASIVLAYSSVNEYFPESSETAEPSSTIPATAVLPETDVLCETSDKAGDTKKAATNGQKPFPQTSTIIPKTPDSVK